MVRGIKQQCMNPTITRDESDMTTRDGVQRSFDRSRDDAYLTFSTVSNWVAQMFSACNILYEQPDARKMCLRTRTIRECRNSGFYVPSSANYSRRSHSTTLLDASTDIGRSKTGLTKHGDRNRYNRSRPFLRRA